MSESRGDIRSLNGLRAAAIIVVIWAHAGLPGPIVGGMGVTAFFFISGYLITTLLRREFEETGRVWLKGFYLRRVLRIFPPLYIVLAVAIVLSATGVITDKMTGGGIVAAATFYANYFKVFVGEGLPGGMTPLWSLAVEEHYYLLFPLAYIAMRKWLPNVRHQVGLLVTVCVAIGIWRCVLALQDVDPFRLYYATDTRADAILWGAVVAIGFNPAYGEVRLPARRLWASVVPLVAAVVFFACTQLPQLGQYSVGFTVESVAMIAILVPLVAVPDSALGKLFNYDVVIYIGRISYALYLTHFPALLAADRLGVNHHLETIIGLSGAVLAAEAMRRLVEDPLGKVRKRLRPGDKRQVATSVAE